MGSVSAIRKVPRQPNCGCGAVTQFPNDLIAGSKDFADVNRIKPFCKVVWKRLFLNLLTLW